MRTGDFGGNMWRDISPGWHYKISKDGVVINSITGKEIKQSISRYGYKRVHLCKDGKMKFFFVHKAVALAFIENPDGKPYVNHKDGNKLNNNVENLEWCTPSENVLHAYRVLGVPAHSQKGTDACKIQVKCIETGITYESARQAERETGINNACISACANGKQHSAGGYTWTRI